MTLGGIVTIWIAASFILAPLACAFIRVGAADDASGEADGRTMRDDAPQHSEGNAR
jgi:hypothetical protein